MTKLIEAALYGHGLIKIKSAVLATRYNECLEKIGVAPTQLTHFQIDCMGWSPEIAEEKNNDYYLCHGHTQSAIVITPDQSKAPIYRPFHSFDAALMQKVYSNALKQIGDVTARTGMWFEIDKDQTVARHPSDLLLFDSITVHAHTVTGVMKAAKEQRDLVRMFSSGKDAWSDSELRTRIIESAKTFGDLRMRQIIINDISFTDVRCFHTAAFEGVFVFRDLKNDGYMLVFENDNEHAKAGLMRDYYRLHDGAMFNRLFREGLVEIDLKWYADNPEAIDELKEYILVEALDLYMPEKKIDYESLTAAHMGRLSVQLGDSLSAVYSELEKFKITLARKGKKKIVPEILRTYLVRPSEDLPESTREVLWHLIARHQPCDVRRLYKWDKQCFFRRYKNWSPSRQKWAVSCLQNGVGLKSEIQTKKGKKVENDN